MSQVFMCRVVNKALKSATQLKFHGSNAAWLKKINHNFISDFDFLHLGYYRVKSPV